MRIVDLFSGAGGLTFGFYYQLMDEEFIRTDNEFIFANEFDKFAAEAFSQNYPDINMIQCDIKELTKDPLRIKNLIGEEDVDIVIGGPPCQSFSTIGKRRFDDKAKLYSQYLKMLSIIQPKMFLFENVKGMLSMREQIPQYNELGTPLIDEKGNEITKPGRLIMEVIEDQFLHIENAEGYSVLGKSILNAKNYGVPQNRERVFIVGIRNDLYNKVSWQYPEPTHGPDRLEYLTVKESISDLPELKENQSINQYGKPAQNEFQALMRGNNDILTEHFCGSHSERLKKIIEAVKPGEGRPYINHLVEIGKLPKECYLTSGYNNTYGRLVENKPSPTITNNMCTPSALRCIHYKQNRELSPREGARIQSFPDWYRFKGNKAHVTTQIGNAVPPVLAMAIARKIEDTIEEINNEC